MKQLREFNERNRLEHEETVRKIDEMTKKVEDVIQRSQEAQRKTEEVLRKSAEERRLHEEWLRQSSWEENLFEEKWQRFHGRFGKTGILPSAKHVREASLLTEAKNYFGVKDGFTLNQINKIRRQKALRVHPDKTTESSDEFLLMERYYEVLKRLAIVDRASLS